MSITELAVEEIASNTYATDAPKRRYTLHELDSSHEHYKRIIVDFQTAGIRVLKIEKLQNPSSADSYVSNRANMIKHRGNLDPDYKINERYLYHGTSADIQHICDEGLDDKLAGEGCFGKGIYFSDNIKKCLKYANRRKGDDALIVCARTILGEAKVYEDGKTDPSLKKEPEKTGSVTGFRFYCSVKGRPREYNEFVVYRKNQTLVEYLITYSKTSPPDTNVTEPIIEPTKPDTSVPPLTEPATSVPLSKCSVSSESSSDEEEAGEHYISAEEDADVNSSLDEGDSASLHSFEDASERADEKEPEEEIDPVKKREIFIEKTGEETDSVIDSFLLATDYHLDIAIDLYLNRDKIEEEMEKMRVCLEEEGLQSTDEDGKKITFHPEGIPHYDSDAWKLHSESEKESFIEKFLSIFMEAIALEREHSEFAKGFLKNNNYNIDETIIAFYSSI